MIPAEPKWVANRLEALRAFLDNEPDGRDWLQQTGLERPSTYRDTSGQWVQCGCPYCEDRDIRHPASVDGFTQPAAAVYWGPKPNPRPSN